MAAKKANILEQSNREWSTESALNAASNRENIGPSAVHPDPFIASTRVNIGPSAIHPDPSTKEHPTENNDDPSTRLLNDSHLQYATIGLPVPANGQPIDLEGSAQMVEGSSSNRCSIFFDWYRNTAIGFRNSRFIHIIHLLLSYIPISAVVMGLIFSHECPQASFLPIFVTAIGVVGVIFMSLWITISCCEHQGNPCSNLQKLALGILLSLFLLCSVIEICLVGHLSPNFDPIAEEYCNKTFYYYIVGKEIQLTVAIIFTAMLYLPGCGLVTFCRNCPMPSPAGAFFHGV